MTFVYYPEATVPSSRRTSNSRMRATLEHFPTDMLQLYRLFALGCHTNPYIEIMSENRDAPVLKVAATVP